MYLPISILAFMLNGVAVTIDKVLLVKVVPDPLLYIFYFSLISFLAVLLLPFTNTPSMEVLMLSSSSTILWTLGAYFMFKALKVGQVSRVIPVIGSLNPLILFLIGLFTSSLLINQIWGILLLISGLVFLTMPDWQGKLTKFEAVFEILSAILFAFSYLILKEAYLRQDAITVLVWSRFILIPLALGFLLVPVLRNKIIPSRTQTVSMIKKGGLLFAFGQASAGISQLLIFFAISLANPALVNSLQGTKYVFLFIVALFLSKKYPAIFEEKYSPLPLISKILGISLIGFGLFTLL